MLVDRAKIFVRSGKGGHGCLSFRREKYLPKGGPDGGDGGRGGDVILVADDSVGTLLPLRPRPHIRAVNGEPGKGKSMHGADGSHRVVLVPVGTVVQDVETGEMVVDLDEHGQRYVVAKGGAGGFGNEHYKSATNQAPREFTMGEPWEEHTLQLELKLLADVGLIGLPNAGKSTLLGQLTRANPKVAAYPFTTLQPHLGIAALPNERRIVMADIPGLIEGAADGAGLGHAFLRHTERTTLLVHVLDVAPLDGSDPVDNYGVIRGELEAYSPALAGKPEVVLFNKIDLVPQEEREDHLRDLTDRLAAATTPLVSSGVDRRGKALLLETLWDKLEGKRPQRGWRAEGPIVETTVNAKINAPLPDPD